jgi:hypothetical protein
VCQHDQRARNEAASGALLQHQHAVCPIAIQVMARKVEAR